RVNNIARWNGSVWLPLGEGDNNGVNSDVYALTVYDGKLIVGGSFTSAGGVDARAIAQWDGVSWSSLNPGQVIFLNSINAMTIWNNNLIVGGKFTKIGEVPANNIAKWNGVSWSSLGAGASNGVLGSVVALTTLNGDVIVGGRFSQAG